MAINSEQIRAARALLGWSQEDLAHASSLSPDTIRRIESGSLQPRTRTLKAIDEVLSVHVEFLPRSGVAMRDDTLRVLEGPNAFLKMLDDIYHTLKESKGDVLFYCADEILTQEDVILAIARLHADDITTRYVIKEGHMNITGNPADFRTIPAEYFHNEPRVVYGNKVAQCLNHKARVLIINDESTATLARKTIGFMWEAGKPLR